MCGACVHMYTCSCLDATLHYTVCKHVHLVQMKISKNVTEMSTTEGNKEKCSHMENHMVTQTPEELLVHYDNRDTKTEDNTVSLEQQCSKQFSDHASEDVLIDLEEQDNSVNINEHSVGENNDLQGEDSIDYYSRILKHEKCVDRTATLHSEIDTLLIKLNTMQRKCCQREILNKIKKHVNSAITITEAALVSPEQCVLSLPVTKQYSPNALHEKQLRFYPTKRKQERMQSCTKPTLEEVKSTKEKLTTLM